MAAAKPTGQLPTGFVSPFKRVAMEERIDDSLSCVATLSGQSLADIKKLAIQFGFPKHGPAWVGPELIAKLLYQYDLVASDYKDVASIDALPDVAILLVDYDPKTEIGRHVIWHHVRGKPEREAFHYLIDVAPWVPIEKQITTDFSGLQMDPPQYFIEVTPRTDGAQKRK